MADPFPISVPFKVANLGSRQATRFDIRPNAADVAALVEYLGVSNLISPRFSGEVRPSGKRDFILEGRLEATVVQPCVVTLAPVRTQIDESVRRTYVADLAPPKDDDIEIPADDTIEPLSAVIDAGAVMVEALLIALPEYPRVPGAELGEIVLAPPGAAPLRDRDLKPFAGLASLVDRLADGEAKSDTEAPSDRTGEADSKPVE